MSTEINELKQARYRSDKTISGHNAFLRPPTGETNSVDTRGFYFVLKEPHPNNFRFNSAIWASTSVSFSTHCSVRERSCSNNSQESSPSACLLASASAIWRASR